jgi:hypothetical protein
MLPALQEAAEKDDIRSIQARPGSPVPHESPKWRNSSALMKNQETTLAVIEAAAASASGSKSEKRALLLRNTDNWLNQLLSEWTVLSGEAPEINRDVNQDTPEELSHEDQLPAPNVEASGHGGKNHHPTKAKSDRHVGDLDVRIKRAEEGYRYREGEPRTTSRKYHGYERERRPDFGQPEKERKITKWPEKTASGLSFNSALRFKTRAQKARDTVKEKIREEEIHTSSTKSRDRDHRSARMDKQSNRRAYVEDDYSGSDSDTATYVTANRPPPPRPSNSPYDSTPRPRSKPEPPRRSTSTLDEEDEDDDKWRPIHGNAIEYIGRSARPGLSGRSISSRTYWGES